MAKKKKTSARKTAPAVPAPLKDALLATIVNSGEAHREISRGSGVAQPVISRFVSGERLELSLSNIEKLCAYFGMEFTKPTRQPVGPPTVPQRGRQRSAKDSD